MGSMQESRVMNACMRVQMGPGGFGRAVDLVAETRDASLGALVDEALQGCADAAQWHVRLQLALGQRDEAANLALAIAQEEQLAGNYKVPFTPSLSVQGCMSGVATSTSKMALPQVAHESLAAAWRAAAAGADGQQGGQLHEAFLLLHSYMLVKPLIRLGDHEVPGAGYLDCMHLLTAENHIQDTCRERRECWCGVAGSIERFPCHTVPILTTAVVECALAGLGATAYDCAASLMRPEHREQINPTYRRKVEGIVRRREWWRRSLLCGSDAHRRD